MAYGQVESGQATIEGEVATALAARCLDLVARARGTASEGTSARGAASGGPARVLVGIVGAPGAGKSTLAADVLAALAQRAAPADSDLPGLPRSTRGTRAPGVTAVVVPMDGFHLADAELARLGRRDRKGAPDTFDAHGYVALLGRLRSPRNGVTVYAPAFDRAIEEPVAGSIPVGPDVELVLTEGNYLLLGGDQDHGRWSPVRTILDETWFLEVPEQVRVERLVARHERHGKPPAAARAWALGPDETNARLVASTRDRADVVVHPS
ncbi:nucleoside/nucleotide kinase family protein [Oerskovia enterophila]